MSLVQIDCDPSSPTLPRPLPHHQHCSHSHVYCMKVLSQKTNQTITLRIPEDGFSKICLDSKDFHVSQLVNLFSDSKWLFDFLMNNKAPFAKKSYVKKLCNFQVLCNKC